MKVFLVISLFLASMNIWAAIEVDDNGNSKSSSRSVVKVDSPGLQFKSDRKIGIGVSTAGALGMLGANLEINFHPQYSITGGFGYGEGYQTFAFQMKHTIGGRWFSPYIGGGYARWYTVGEPDGNIRDTNPGFLAKRFLNDRELETGVYSENLIYSMAGLQYFQLSGSYSGMSLYAQVMMLLDVDEFNTAPTGELGIFFYF